MSRQKVNIDQLIVPAGTPDGHAPTVSGGELVYSEGGSGGTALVPLTTTLNGVPELVWEADDSLALTEVPL